MARAFNARNKEAGGKFNSDLNPVEPGSAMNRSSHYVKYCGKNHVDYPLSKEHSPLAKLKLEEANKAYPSWDIDRQHIYAYTLGKDTEQRLWVEVCEGLNSNDPEWLQLHGKYICGFRRALLKRIRDGKNVRKGIVYHCTHAKPDIINKLKPGYKFLQPSFMSTSKNEMKDFGAVTFKIDLDGYGLTYAVDISDSSQYPDEAEIILYPYSGLEVLKNYTVDGRQYIDLRTYDTLEIDNEMCEDDMDNNAKTAVGGM